MGRALERKDGGARRAQRRVPSLTEAGGSLGKVPRGQDNSAGSERWPHLNRVVKGQSACTRQKEEHMSHVEDAASAKAQRWERAQHG